MKRKKEFCCPNCGSNREKRCKIAFGVYYGSAFSTKDMLILLKLKKRAKTRECKDCGAFEVTCPFCEQTTTQMEETRSYHCPYCLRRSFINTSYTFDTLSKKEFNEI
jgi:ribosomal protein L37AE/L43A